MAIGKSISPLTLFASAVLLMGAACDKFSLKSPPAPPADETTAPAAAGPTKAALCHCPVSAPARVYPSLMLETPTLCQNVLSLPSRAVARASLNHAASTASR